MSKPKSREIKRLEKKIERHKRLAREWERESIVRGKEITELQRMFFAWRRVLEIAFPEYVEGCEVVHKKYLDRCTAPSDKRLHITKEDYDEDDE